MVVVGRKCREICENWYVVWLWWIFSQSCYISCSPQRIMYVWDSLLIGHVEIIKNIWYTGCYVPFLHAVYRCQLACPSERAMDCGGSLLIGHVEIMRNVWRNVCCVTFWIKFILATCSAHRNGLWELEILWTCWNLHIHGYIISKVMKQL